MGWYLTSASRTADEPTPAITGIPPFMIGRNSASRSAAWSMGVSRGGTWKLKITRSVVPIASACPAMYAASSSSGSSRGESHGVLLE